MILMLQIFDVIANENARYKRNELEFYIYITCICIIFKELVSFFSQFMGNESQCGTNKSREPINREKGDLSCMFLIHINSNNINSILKLN